MAQFARYWGDCPFRRYLATNEIAAAFDGFETLRLGEDVSWSDNLSRALAAIEEDYVLLFLEDLILKAPVDRRLLTAAMEWARANLPDHLRLNASERPDERVNSRLGRIREGSHYRTSTVLTLWKKSVLSALLRPGESAWQFELVGSARSDAYPRFYSTYADCFPVINCVIKGKWRPSAVRALAAQGVSVDLAARAPMTRGQDLAFRARELRSRVFKLVPMRYRRSVRSCFYRRRR